MKKIIREYRVGRVKPPVDHAGILNKLSQEDVNGIATRILLKKNSITNEARDIGVSTDKLTEHLAKNHKGFGIYKAQKVNIGRYQHKGAVKGVLIKGNFKEDAVPVNAMSAAIAGPHSEVSMPKAPILGYTARKAIEDAKALISKRRRRRGGK